MIITDVKRIIEGMSRDQETDLLRWMLERQWGKLTPSSRPSPSPAPPSPVLKWPAMCAVEEWWLGRLMTGDLLPGRGWFDSVLLKALTDDYSTETCSRTRHGNDTSIARYLERMVPGMRLIAGEIGPGENMGARRYRFPDLATCRKAFEAVYGEQDWGGKS